MSETKIQIYDENSLAECRICLENGETALITPCNCRGSQKYVHLECLNKLLLLKPCKYLNRAITSPIV